MFQISDFDAVDHLKANLPIYEIRDPANEQNN